MPPRRVDVHGDLFLRVLRLQKQELCRDQGGHLVLDWARDEDNALLQEARINVISPLAAVGLLDHHGYQRVQVYMAQVFHCCPEGLDGPEISTWGCSSLALASPLANAKPASAFAFAN